jgi:hypothetical protein
METAIQFFEEYDWPFSKSEHETVLQTSFHGDNGEWSCYVFASEEQQRLAFYSICPVSAAEDKRMAVAEFITCVNYGLVIGNFELDSAGGEVRFKTSIDVDGDRLSTALVKRVVLPNVAMMDMYLPGIMKVIYGDASPAQAVAEIEDGGGNQSA